MFGLRERLDRRRLSGLWQYTLMFSALIFVVWGIFYYFDKSYVWTPDGEDIYFVIMTYTRNYIHGIFRTLFHTGKLVLPAWDFSIGQGNNVMVGAHFSPFFLIALICPTRFLEYAYGLMTLSQLYCTGVAFILFARRLGLTEAFPTSLGAIVYAFCGFVFHAGFSHIYFICNMMIYLPLILAAAERYLQDRKWGCFVAIIAITLISGYYYAYMDTLLMTLYLLVRQLCVNGKALKKSFFELMRLFLLYLWGFALSMVIFLPSVMNYFICGRTDTGEGATPLFYSLKTYGQMFSSFAAPQMSGDWSQTSFAGIALIALTVIFLRREQETRVVRWSFGIMTAFFCLPYAGKVFNGFGYVTNRWCFGYALCVAMATAYGAKRLWELNARERKIVIGVAVGWGALSLAVNPRRNVVVGAVLLALTLLAVLAKDRSGDHSRGKARVAAMTALTLTVHTMIFFLPPFQNEINRYKDGGRVVSGLMKTAEMASRGLEDDSFYRIEVAPTRTNRFALAGENGVSSYWSALPAKMTSFYQSFELAAVRLSYAIWGLDSCTALDTLAGVKYVVNQDDTGERTPYGFERTGEVHARSRTYQVYMNRYALPLGYTYDAAMSEEAFLDLNPVERQQAMLQCAVMGQIPEGLEERTPEITAKKLDYTITEMKKVKCEDGRTFKAQAGGTVTISFEPQRDSETYLYLANLVSGRRSDLTVTSGGVSRKTSLYSEGALHYFPREGIAFNLCYQAEGRGECTIQFPAKGTFTFDIEVYALPMEDYRTQATALGQQVLEDIRVGTDVVTGSITVEQPRLLVLTIPHIGGWSASVDGEPTQLLEVNALYMGLMLEEGTHHIRLEYHMPGLNYGAAISGAAALGLVLYAAAAGYRRRRQTTAEEQKTESGR